MILETYLKFLIPMERSQRRHLLQKSPRYVYTRSLKDISNTRYTEETKYFLFYKGFAQALVICLED